MSEQGNPDSTQKQVQSGTFGERAGELALQATIDVLERRLREAYAQFHSIDELTERIKALEEQTHQLQHQLDERYRELAALTGMLVKTEADMQLQQTHVRPSVLSGSRLGRLFVGIRSKVVMRRMRRDIIASGLFDPVWYAVRYPDVAASGIDPLEHYICFGAKEGRGVGPSFDMEAYLIRNPFAIEGNPLLHYLEGAGMAGKGRKQ